MRLGFVGCVDAACGPGLVHARPVGQTRAQWRLMATVREAPGFGSPPVRKFGSSYRSQRYRSSTGPAPFDTQGKTSLLKWRASLGEGIFRRNLDC